MPNGLTGVIGDGPLTRSESALIAATGTPSHDMHPRRRFFPGPQHGRWRSGYSSARLQEVTPFDGGGTFVSVISSCTHTIKDGIRGSVRNFENATWVNATSRLTVTGIGANLVATPSLYVVITTYQGGWVPGIYPVTSVVDDDTVELGATLGNSAVLPADNALATGFLGEGEYCEPFTPIGAPVGAAGGSNLFNLPAVSQNDFGISQSKYWDYPTFFTPPGGPAGGARQVFYMLGRFKAPNIHSRPYLDNDSDGLPEIVGGVDIVVVLDPFSSVFTSYARAHNEASYRETKRCRMGWRPDIVGDVATFEDASGQVRAVPPSRQGSQFTDAQPVYFCKADPASGALPDTMADGRTYYVDAVANGKYTLFYDKGLTVPVNATDFSGEALMSTGSQGSHYQLRWTFTIPPRLEHYRNCVATEATDVVEHAGFANRKVGDVLVCSLAGGTDHVKDAVYYIVSKPTPTSAVLSATEGGAAFDNTVDSTTVCFRHLRAGLINLDDFAKCEIEIIADADGSSDNNEKGVRWPARLRLSPYRETVGAVVLGAGGGAQGVGFEEYEGVLSRTFPGRSNATSGPQIAVGAPSVLAKNPYYNDGTNNFRALTSTQWDYGGQYDILHLNGTLYLYSQSTNGLYDYPLEAHQGDETHGLASSTRRALKTYVYRASAPTVPVAEVVFHHDVRQLCGVRMLREGDYFVRDDDLVFKTWRYVRVHQTGTVLNLAWDPATRTLTGTGAFTNLPFDATPTAPGAPCYNKIVLKSFTPKNTGTNNTTHEPHFTPGIYDIESKTSNNAIVLTPASAALMPPYAVSDTGSGLPGANIGTIQGYYERPAGSQWDFAPIPIQERSTILGPTFETAAYTVADTTITEAGAFADWDWYSGATVFIVSGGGFSAQSTHVVTAATDDTLVVPTGPGSNGSAIKGQLFTNIPIKPALVERGPQPTFWAARVGLSGPPDGNVDLEINTYWSELLDAGSR